MNEWPKRMWLWKEQEIAYGYNPYGPCIEVLVYPSESARPCTCHPEDNPPRPCEQKYALNECKESAIRAQAECLTPPPQVTK